MNNNPYLNILLEAAPRLLNLIDKQAFSNTFGCFDRTYAQWKFTDFPASRLQEGTLSLTLLYSTDFEGNPYYKNTQIKNYIYASLNYWCKIQNSNGSFNEAYPNEHSFVATAFTLFAVTESILILKDNGLSVSSDIENAVKKASDFLTKNEETHAFISNHLSGAALALFNAFLLLGNEKYKSRSEFFINKIFDSASSEGWFMEYDGPDPGYETQGLWYLSVLFEKNPSESFKEKLSASIRFLQYFVHPDGTIGGDYGSRNTEFFFPGGIEILAKYFPEASAISKKMQASLENSTVVTCKTIDIFNFIPLFNSTFFAFLNFKPEIEAALKLPCENTENYIRHFKYSNIYVRNDKYFYLIINIKKGGVTKIFRKNNSSLAYSFAGYLAEFEGHNIIWASTQSAECLKTDVSFEKIFFETDFHKIRQSFFAPSTFCIFRLFVLSLGRLYGVSRLIKKALVKRLILLPKNRTGIKLQRTVKIHSGSIEIDDIISGKTIQMLKKLYFSNKFNSRHMGSASYFQYSDLSGATEKLYDSEKLSVENDSISFKYRIN